MAKRRTIRSETLAECDAAAGTEEVGLKSWCLDRSEIGAPIRRREANAMAKGLIVGFNGEFGSVPVERENVEVWGKR